MSGAKAFQNRFFRDAFLLFTGVKALRYIGIKPSSFWGGTTLGFFGGNMAGVYGFDARETLTHVEAAMSGELKTTAGPAPCPYAKGDDEGDGNKK